MRLIDKNNAGKLYFENYYLIETFGQNVLLLLFSRLIREFPISLFFLEPINRELELRHY